MTSTTSSLLAEALHSETIKRETERNQRASEMAERDAIVTQLHAGVRAVESQLTALSLQGDYGIAVPFADAQGRNGVEAIYQLLGIKVALGPRISPQALSLTIAARDGTTPASAHLRIERHYPWKTEEVKSWDAHTPTDEMLTAFFAELAKRVVTPGASALEYAGIAKRSERPPLTLKRSWRRFYCAAQTLPPSKRLLAFRQRLSLRSES